MKPILRKLLLVLIIISFILSCAKEEKQQSAPQQIINELPHLKFISLDGTATSTRNIETPLVLILFFADCDHCQREAQEIQKNLGLFKGKNIQFISAEEIPVIQKFSVDYGLNNEPNVKFGKAESVDVYMNFGSIPTPAIYVYSAEKRLVKSFKGETPVAEIAGAFR
ncbi:MAG: redoxin domain-containing protein [Cyclobacteriaceae bacterium]|nr:redoxin domain-containing protein [Cyclobacteriaceae bacterium]